MKSRTLFASLVVGAIASVASVAAAQGSREAAPRADAREEASETAPPRNANAIALGRRKSSYARPRPVDRKSQGGHGDAHKGVKAKIRGLFDK